MTRKLGLAVLLTAGLASNAYASSFVNGDFETGNANGWTTGSGFRGAVTNNLLNATDVLSGGSLFQNGLNHSSIVSPGLVAETGNQLNQVFQGSFSWRVEDTVNGGYASAIQQTVNNYTDPDIFFAWAAVLEGAHGTNDAATIKIQLRDLTTNTLLVNRSYNAADTGNGVDARFKYNQPTNMYWTPWQTEQIAIDQTLSGHNFLLSILASDCQPTGHEGFLFLDGFGGVAPTPDAVTTPEPASLLLLGTGLVAAVVRLRRRRS